MSSVHPSTWRRRRRGEADQRKQLRVLQKQADGSWKAARAMVTTE